MSDPLLAVVSKFHSREKTRNHTSLKAGFHWLRSQSRSRNQKRRAYDLVKTAFRFRLLLRRLRSAYDLVKTRLSESIWFSLDHKRNVSDGVVSVVGRKWKGSSDSDSVALMTPLTTPIFDFHKVISALTTPFTTPTPSLVKTSLKNVKFTCLVYIFCQTDNVA